MYYIVGTIIYKFKYLNYFKGCALQTAVCQDEYTAIGNSGERYPTNSTSLSLQDYSGEYNTIRMIHEPQNHASETSNNINSGTVGIYSSASTGSPSNETSTGRHHSLLPTFPSYFNNREGKALRHSTQKAIRSHSIEIHTPMSESMHSHSSENMTLPINYHQHF